ncbi:MAG: hypothetical protein ACK5KN_12780 [Dysgonomonas sp.]|uniref:hypothetical protein n=1 Tax=Dysgonomonas sp. TaxID=1891233 RepID=UPI003A84D752
MEDFDIEKIKREIEDIRDFNRNILKDIIAYIGTITEPIEEDNTTLIENEKIDAYIEKLKQPLSHWAILVHETNDNKLSIYIDDNIYYVCKYDEDLAKYKKLYPTKNIECAYNFFKEALEDYYTNKQ